MSVINGLPGFTAGVMSMKGHKAKRQNSMLRGYSTFDLIFASIILFLIFSIGMIVITEIVSRSDVENIAREFNLDYLMIDFGDCGERYEYGEMKEERICITRLGIVDGDVCGITICI